MAAVIDSDALQAIFESPNPDGAFEGKWLAYFRGVGARCPILLLAFAPKAAGTYLRQAAMEALDGRLIRMTHAQGGRDATPYLPSFLACYLDADAQATISHLHMQALPANRNFIRAFGLKPVIMILNIPDMLASYWDMLETNATARADGLNCLIPENFVAMERPEKADTMIDIIAPWYVSYFATWRKFVAEAPQSVCVLRYEDFCSDPAASLHLAVMHAGFAVTRAKCEAAMTEVWKQRTSLRYNKGVSGRGKKYFSSDHFGRLSRMISHYEQLESWRADLL